MSQCRDCGIVAQLQSSDFWFTLRLPRRSWSRESDAAGDTDVLLSCIALLWELSQHMTQVAKKKTSVHMYCHAWFGETAFSCGNFLQTTGYHTNRASTFYLLLIWKKKKNPTTFILARMQASYKKKSLKITGLKGKLVQISLLKANIWIHQQWQLFF